MAYQDSLLLLPRPRYGPPDSVSIPGSLPYLRILSPSRSRDTSVASLSSSLSICSLIYSLKAITMALPLLLLGAMTPPLYSAMELEAFAGKGCNESYSLGPDTQSNATNLGQNEFCESNTMPDANGTMFTSYSKFITSCDEVAKTFKQTSYACTDVGCKECSTEPQPSGNGYTQCRIGGHSQPHLSLHIL